MRTQAFTKNLADVSDNNCFCPCLIRQGKTALHLIRTMWNDDYIDVVDLSGLACLQSQLALKTRPDKEDFVLQSTSLTACRQGDEMGTKLKAEFCFSFYTKF